MLGIGQIGSAIGRIGATTPNKGVRIDVVPAAYNAAAGTILGNVRRGMVLSSSSAQVVSSPPNLIMGPATGLDGYPEPGRFYVRLEVANG